MALKYAKRVLNRLNKLKKLQNTLNKMTKQKTENAKMETKTETEPKTKKQKGKHIKNYYETESGARIYPLIPARSGSSLKDKNLREYKGTPLLQNTIQKLNEVFGICHVSTDSELYAEKAEQWGAKPHLITERIEGNQDITAQIQKFVSDLNIPEEKSWILVCQCTSPNTSVKSFERVKGALETFNFGSASIICSVAKLRQKITGLFYRKNDEDFHFTRVWEGDENYGRIVPPSCPRQLIPECYFLTGGFFAVPVYKTKHCRSFFDGSEIIPIVVSLAESLDIDRLEDFNL